MELVEVEERRRAAARFRTAPGARPSRTGRAAGSRRAKSARCAAAVLPQRAAVEFEAPAVSPGAGAREDRGAGAAAVEVFVVGAVAGSTAVLARRRSS